MANNFVSVLDTQSFERMLSENSMVMVDFWAVWCAPCRMVAPILEALAEDYAGKLVIGKISVDDYQDIASKYEVMSIPTMIIFKDGQEVERIVGAQGKAALAAAIDRHVG